MGRTTSHPCRSIIPWWEGHSQALRPQRDAMWSRGQQPAASAGLQQQGVPAWCSDMATWASPTLVSGTPKERGHMCPQSRGWKEGVQGWDSRAAGERRSGHSPVLVGGWQKPQKWAGECSTGPSPRKDPKVSVPGRDSGLGW